MMNRMQDIIKKVPVPLCGVILATASLGNLLNPYSSTIHHLCGIFATFLLALVLLKLVMYPKMVANDMKNPIIASASGTFPMSLMVLSTYAAPLIGKDGAYLFWLAAIALHLTLMVYFTFQFMMKLKIKDVFASYFIVYVGIAVAAVTAPSHGKEDIGAMTFAFGFAALFLLAGLISYRYIKHRDIPQGARPLFCIYAAPVSLCLTGYLQSVENVSTGLVMALLIVATVVYAIVLYKAIHYLMRLPFYPSYAGFTFPFVICPTAATQALAHFESMGYSLISLNILVAIEIIIGVAIVCYTILRYMRYLFTDIEDKLLQSGCTEVYFHKMMPHRLCSDSIDD